MLSVLVLEAGIFASVIHDLFQEKDDNSEIIEAEVKKLSDILLLPEMADL